jgi:hypothetical protein
MSKHEYRLCNKCKGHGYCDCEGKGMIYCPNFVKKDAVAIWSNPSIDHFDKYQELLKNGKVIM